MFRVDARYETGMPFLDEEGTRTYWVVEQCLNHPLWQIRVLTPARNDAADAQYWTRILATSTSHALGVLLGEAWEEVEANVIFPESTSGDKPALLTRCSAIWECRDLRGRGLKAWLLQTDHGDRLDSPASAEPADFERTTLRWMAPPRAPSSPDPDQATRKKQSKRKTPAAT